jgi:short-subunit dehydrogenase
MSGVTFKNSVVVITGASSGIGRELAYQLAGQGAWVSLAARDGRRLEHVQKECIARGGRAMVFRTDVSNESECSALINQTIAIYGRIDTLVNNAGLSMWAKFEDITDLSLFDTIMRVNYLGSVYCTYYALPHLKKSKGRIVGISSLTGKTGVPTRTGYAASKHAMAGFFDSLRIELEDSGISVTVIYPGFVATEVRERAFGANGKPLGKSPMEESNVMPSDECARQIIGAMARRKRELVMTTRGKLGLWMKLISPGAVDRVAKKAIQKGKT